MCFPMISGILDFPEIGEIVRPPNFVLMTFGLNTWPRVSILWPFTDKLHVQEAIFEESRLLIKTEGMMMTLT